MNNKTASQMASIITRLTLARTLLHSVDGDIDILYLDAHKQANEKLSIQLDRLMKDLFQFNSSIGDICIEIPEIFISLNQGKSLSSDSSELLNPETLIQLRHMIASMADAATDQ